MNPQLTATKKPPRRAAPRYSHWWAIVEAFVTHTA